MTDQTTETPTAILAGCSRSGSTSLFQMLAASTQIAQSKLKEPGFFLGSYYREQGPPQSEYSNIFSLLPGASLRLEATAAYFYAVPEVPDLIASTLPDARIILIFREPHARLVSELKYLKTRFLIDAETSLEHYVAQCLKLTDIDYRKRSNMHLLGVRNGYYDRCFPHWSSRFGDRLKVVFHDDLATDPQRVLADITMWLDLQSIALPTTEIQNMGRSFRAASVQRRALAVNDRLEPFFRRHPALKATLRKGYYRVNGAPREIVQPLHDEHAVSMGYARSLQVFREQLLEWSPSLVLPSWLAG